jgi:hypothetical protein
VKLRESTETEKSDEAEESRRVTLQDEEYQERNSRK